jgi:hypothetical protein
MKSKRILTEDDLTDIETTVSRVLEGEAKEVVEEAIEDALAELDVEEIVKDASQLKWEVVN